MLFSAGNVGYLISGIKVASEVHVGDTITSVENPGEALKGFEKVKPMVFAGIYPLIPRSLKSFVHQWKNCS